MERVLYCPRAMSWPGRGEGIPPASTRSRQIHLNRSGVLLGLAVALAGATACDELEPLSPETPDLPVAAAVTSSGAAIVSRHASNMCLTIENGVAVLAQCNGGSAQRFAFESDGRIRYGNLCLSTQSGSAPLGDRVTAAGCSGGANQKWTTNSAGEIRGINGYCIDIYGESKAAGARIVVWSCHGGSNQRWSVSDIAVPPPTTVSKSAIASRHATNMCLAIENGLAVLAQCNGGSAQQFALESDGRIRYGSLCLSTQNGSAPQGDRVTAASCTGASNQRWTANGAGEIRGINGYCIDIYAESKAAGARVVVWSCHGGTNQRWSVQSATVSPSAGRPVQSLHASNMCLAIQSGRAVLASCSGSASQQFAFQSDGSVRIGDLCLSTQNGSAPQGDRVTAASCNGAANQRWAANGSREIRGVNGYCIDIYAEARTAGAPIVVWGCHGGSNQRWDVSGAPPPPPPPPPPTSTGGGADHRGTILFRESFDDANLTSRGWYDVDAPRISTSQRAAGSAGSFECRFSSGRTECDGGVPGRHEFAEVDQLYVSYWVKYQSGWVGSGRAYHPHEMIFLNNMDGRYAAPAYSRLALYVEQVSGRPRVALQDAANVDPNCILRNDNVLVGCSGHTISTYPFGETRSAAACNGLAGPVDGRDCYSLGGGRWYSMRYWRSQASLTDGGWHFVETYMKLNSVSSGRGNADGIVRQWVDGARVLNVSGVLLRTGEHSNIRIEQLLFAPYMGSGSPITQTVWYDELTVAAGRQP